MTSEDGNRMFGTVGEAEDGRVMDGIRPGVEDGMMGGRMKTGQIKHVDGAQEERAARRKKHRRNKSSIKHIM